MRDDEAWINLAILDELNQVRPVLLHRALPANMWDGCSVLQALTTSSSIAIMYRIFFVCKERLDSLPCRHVHSLLLQDSTTLE